MRDTLLFTAVAFVFIALAVLAGQVADVGAIGAPTDNSTVLNVPPSDQSQGEIKPPVNYVLQGSTLQSESTPPKFISDFIGPSENGRFTITADEDWYLDVDINTPGWLYVYEYFPEGEDYQGRWIAYKWQLQQSGLWRLGPFTPGNNEPEGQHIYRLWFYSDGQWAVEDPNLPQNNLIYWTYLKGQPSEQPAEQIPSQPQPTVSKEATFGDKAYEFIKQPVVWWLGPLLIVVVVGLGLYVPRVYARWGRSQGTVLPPAGAELEVSPAAVSPGAASAKIVLPNGVELLLAGNSRVIGRRDLARALSIDDLGIISRRHFEVKYEEEQFYIEDLGSANGTKLNGEDISGKGLVSLNNDDVIEPAGIIRLKFYLL